MFKSKLLNVMWAINGIAFFLLVIFGIVYLVFETFPQLFEEDYEYNKGVIIGRKQEKATELGIDLQHVLYDSPQKVPYSNYYYSEVRVLDKEIPKEFLKTIASANDVSLNMIGGTINIIFYNDEQDEVHTLLEDYGFIEKVNMPRYYRNIAEDKQKKRDYILYEISLDDTNGDMRINSEDSSAYFISDLNGRNLKRITPMGLDLDYHWLDESYDRIYFENIEILKDKDELGFLLKTRHIYIYDLKADKFSKLEKLQQTFDEIQEKFRNSN
jgi:hypothetical protein